MRGPPSFSSRKDQKQTLWIDEDLSMLLSALSQSRVAGNADPGCHNDPWCLLSRAEGVEHRVRVIMTAENKQTTDSRRRDPVSATSRCETSPGVLKDQNRLAVATSTQPIITHTTISVWCKHSEEPRTQASARGEAKYIDVAQAARAARYLSHVVRLRPHAGKRGAITLTVSDVGTLNETLCHDPAICARDRQSRAS